MQKSNSQPLHEIPWRARNLVFLWNIMSSQTGRCPWHWISKKVNLFVSFITSTISSKNSHLAWICLNAIPGTFLRFFPLISTSRNPSIISHERTATNQWAQWSQSNQWNQFHQKSMKWGVDLSTQLSKKGPNHRDEWLKKRRSCNTILDAHIKNLTPKKGQLVRLYTNMLFWSQNQVQTKRFPVSVCKKHGILLTSDLFEAKPCEHVAVPWQHLTPSTKPTQTHAKPTTFKGPEVSWYQPWHLDIPTSFWNLSRVHFYYLPLNMFEWSPWIWRYKVKSVCSPYKSLKPVQLHQSVDFNFPLWPAGSRSILGTSGPWLRPECEI